MAKAAHMQRGIPSWKRLNLGSAYNLPAGLEGVRSAMAIVASNRPKGKQTMTVMNFLWWCIDPLLSSRWGNSELDGDIEGWGSWIAGAMTPITHGDWSMTPPMHLIEPILGKPKKWGKNQWFFIEKKNFSVSLVLGYPPTPTLVSWTESLKSISWARPPWILVGVEVFSTVFTTINFQDSPVYHNRCSRQASIFGSPFLRHWIYFLLMVKWSNERSKSHDFDKLNTEYYIFAVLAAESSYQELLMNG